MTAYISDCHRVNRQLHKTTLATGSNRAVCDLIPYEPMYCQHMLVPVMATLHIIHRRTDQPNTRADRNDPIGTSQRDHHEDHGRSSTDSLELDFHLPPNVRTSLIKQWHIIKAFAVGRIGCRVEAE